MANLSDLLGSTAPREVPDWIGALETGRGFQLRDWSSDAPRTGRQDPADHGALHAAALSDAYSCGHADGLSAAATQRANDDAARAALTLAFARLDGAARAALTEQLVQAVAGLCEQMIEPALIDRAALAQRCGALTALLGDAAGQCSLHLHPDDLPLLSAELAGAWAIQPDPALPRGSLLLEHADGAVADGPEEWRRLIAGALSA